jgi:hypothetical protein
MAKDDGKIFVSLRRAGSSVTKFPQHRSLMRPMAGLFSLFMLTRSKEDFLHALVVLLIPLEFKFVTIQNLKDESIQAKSSRGMFKTFLRLTFKKENPEKCHLG